MTMVTAASASERVLDARTATPPFPPEGRHDVSQACEDAVYDLRPTTPAKDSWGQGAICEAAGRSPWQAHLLLRFYKAGRVTGLFGDTPTVLEAGDIHLADAAVSFRACGEKVKQLTYLIPYDAVGYDPTRHPAQLRLSSSTAQGRMLEAAMCCLAEQLPNASADEARTLALGLTGLLQGLLLGENPADSSCPNGEACQPTAMRRYIDENLNNQDLGAELLCRVFHASRATVYRHFAEVGGVARYVKERRLDRTFGELAAQPATRGRIRQVAERWGFFEAGHFNRIFRQRFGLSPSEVAALREVSGAAAALDAGCGIALACKPA